MAGTDGVHGECIGDAHAKCGEAAAIGGSDPLDTARAGGTDGRGAEHPALDGRGLHGG